MSLLISISFETFIHWAFFGFGFRLNSILINLNRVLFAPYPNVMFVSAKGFLQFFSQITEQTPVYMLVSLLLTHQIWTNPRPRLVIQRVEHFKRLLNPRFVLMPHWDVYSGGPRAQHDEAKGRHRKFRVPGGKIQILVVYYAITLLRYGDLFTLREEQSHEWLFTR